ncbi:hypothetical protein DOK_11561 [gamma proteobacterium BDW918]|nr:hypothetical protein DOK_11561 [gamma proteobacterium BDW918]
MNPAKNRKLTTAQKRLFDWLNAQTTNDDDGWVCQYPAQERVMDALVEQSLVEVHYCAGSREFRALSRPDVPGTIKAE